LSAKILAVALAILAGSHIVYNDLQQTGLPQPVFAPSDCQLVVKMHYLLTR
jgi:hypothetical protein